MPPKASKTARTNAWNAKLDQEVESLKDLIGDVQSSAQIIEASNYQDDLLNSDNDNVKREAFTHYLKNKIKKYPRVWLRSNSTARRDIRYLLCSHLQ